MYGVWLAVWFTQTHTLSLSHLSRLFSLNAKTVQKMKEKWVNATNYLNKSARTTKCSVSTTSHIYCASILMYRTILCTVQYCTALHCTALHHFNLFHRWLLTKASSFFVTIRLFSLCHATLKPSILLSNTRTHTHTLTLTHSHTCSHSTISPFHSCPSILTLRILKHFLLSISPLYSLHCSCLLVFPSFCSIMITIHLFAVHLECSAWTTYGYS